MKKAEKKLKIAVAMSGGVDSSVAAKLLKDQGHVVVGIFLHFWQEESNSPCPPLPGGLKGVFENKCCSREALLDARRVAIKIGIPLYTLNFAKIFKKQVADNFLSEYGRGRTPNPCVRCNKLVKLGFLIKQAKKLGFAYVASGHYARLRREFPISNFQFLKNAKNTNNKYIYKLHKAKDKNKDQSYFLYTLSQDELKHLLFPLGNYAKTQVRAMAKRWKLPVAEKADSQEICFIEGKDHNEFLRRHLKLKPGLIKTLDGKTVGAHQGLPLYTIGQRKGLKIGGSGPFYAAKMDYQKNILYVVDKSNHPLICKNWLAAKNINWLSGLKPKLPLKCRAVIRYHHQAADCVISKINNHNLKVKFSRPQRAITPGQSAVFYRGGEALGGGIIV
ncbi:MAG: tRNA-specific 2-thiouridylase MnmA [Parcubacteria group bacterium GW2011_GWA2_44_15]|uniref:tRNA-specific 2-thiouridylase MnmA n=1 Tax=Candidatus Falkowbacteria bacterium RIFCSPHIGHO2_02_FULL_42_9 TaxID=1797986 RepID=A0A1F5SA08_9BACT|nr:MAG: tRNA-specific 2-thiouridylase MnmA [Parcubacteria group bacterium GW2011_GWA2_44_15]OGF23548.1 MAG: tRNA 2-thiouridine(34) synthase MnmA [Candidatus Falkowbacteria bacterium RIFCSPHIGHO2_02_FULL_42_9]